MDIFSLFIAGVFLFGVMVGIGLTVSFFLNKFRLF